MLNLGLSPMTDHNSPLPSPSYSAIVGLGNTARALALRWSGRSGLATGHRMRNRSKSLSKPTITKTYPGYPEIECRVFIPRPEHSQPGLLPLYVDVHGGGFIMGMPEMDDFFCAKLAEHGICVVAISHQKAPRWKFPTAIHDVSNLVMLILGSDSLPINKSRVVVGGFSTGGTLALGAVQTDELRDRVRGVVAFSPLTDMSLPVSDKLASVPENSEPDRLGEEFADLVQRTYLPSATDLRNPLLSPIYAQRSQLPTNVYIISSEFDMLSAEAERMAVGMAAQEVSDRRLGGEEGWVVGNIVYEKVKGFRHNFTHITEKGQKEIERQQVVEDLFNRVGTWLREKVYL